MNVIVVSLAVGALLLVVIDQMPADIGQDVLCFFGRPEQELLKEVVLQIGGIGQLLRLAVQGDEVASTGPVETIHPKGRACVCQRAAQLVLEIRPLSLGKDIHELNNQIQDHVQGVFVHIQVPGNMGLAFQQTDEGVK